MRKAGKSGRRDEKRKGKKENRKKKRKKGKEEADGRGSAPLITTLSLGHRVLNGTSG